MSTEREPGDGQLAELLRHLDHPVPSITAQDIAARARAGARPWTRLAAGIVLALVLGGVAYALPGSPLPRWLDAVARSVAGPPATSPAAPPAPAALPAPGGLSFDPGEPLTVVIDAVPEGATLEVLTSTADAIVLLAEPGVARFTSEPGLVHVTPLAPGTLELRVPRAAARVEVRVDGRRLFLLERGAQAASVSADARGRYVFPLGPR